MPLAIISAEARIAGANAKTTMAIFGPSGVGKTSLLKTLTPEATLCVDLEAGMKSVQDWAGDSIPIRAWPDAVDIACLIGGIDPAADASAFFSEGHYRHVAEANPDLVRLSAQKRIIFVDSITDLTRQCMAWAKVRPESFSEKTGKPDVRGTYGTTRPRGHCAPQAPAARGREDRDLRRDPRAGRRRLQPRAVAAADGGGKAARELPGIVDQVVSMSLFEKDGDGWRHEPTKGEARRLVCRSGNPYGLPAKDRSGRLEVTERPDLAALLAKINRTARSA